MVDIDMGVWKLGYCNLHGWVIPQGFLPIKHTKSHQNEYRFYNKKTKTKEAHHSGEQSTFSSHTKRRGNKYIVTTGWVNEKEANKESQYKRIIHHGMESCPHVKE